MSFNRDKERDAAVTRQLILNRSRPEYTGGENWLGHGVKGGRDAVIDYLLLDGATMTRLLEERNTEASIRSHFGHLGRTHGLPVARGPDGKYRFDREHLGIPEPSGTAANAEAGLVLPEEITQPAGLIEGAIRTITINAYERNSEARRRCIAHYRARCTACGFDFGTTYGEIAEGFIHVHHVKPLSEIGTEYEVDPVADLRPVCPNCHAVIHLGGGCRSIDEIRRLLGRGTA